MKDEWTLRKASNILTIVSPDGRNVCRHGESLTLRGMFGSTVSVRSIGRRFEATVKCNGFKRKFDIATDREVSVSLM